MSETAMSAAKKLAAMKAQVAELERLVEEEWKKAEEERQRAKVEKKRAEEERRRRKSSHPDLEYEEEEEDEDEAEGAGKDKGKGKETAGLLKPSFGAESPCLNAKGLPAPMQAQVNRKSGKSLQRKRVKKSAPIIVEDKPKTPMRKTKKMGSKATPQSSEKGPRAAAGKEWSTDPELEKLSDRKLLQHVLVESQKTRLGMSQLLRSLEEEGELRMQWALVDSKVMRQAVRKEAGK
ncbi:hypothetical protein PYCCODRAFT_1469467 [Trametes coccinea BRFM310]|uniref:Uncharacterized protein n=1 Tax=Trametes coccinea (strain BRFM310) TaxID=1353009 RepID=A0A1Y2IIJ8_TRAC3|nr:hypothetical protein PYCCODRAFT_1469467 [Trametes coccinea BRFM310]